MALCFDSPSLIIYWASCSSTPSPSSAAIKPVRPRGDQAGAAHAYKTFLAAYDAEIVTGRAEYRDHQSGIDSFRHAAKASVGGNP
jgi:hypothetical protein